MSDIKDFEEIDSLPVEEEGQVKFHTGILTYPSDFNGYLSVGVITDFLEQKFRKNKGIKIVIAREDADKKIQRNHFHIYLDSNKQLQISPRKYFDIKLPEKLVVFVGYDKKRTYKSYEELESQLGWDSYEEMAARLSSYCCKHKWDYFDILESCHPNLQIKKRFGSKYQMLRYVIKQGLVARANFDVEKELDYLIKNEIELQEKFKGLKEIGKLFNNKNIDIMEELKKLCRDYAKKFKNECKKEKKEEEFLEWLRVKVIEENLTEQEIKKEILSDTAKWYIFGKNYLNYSKILNDLFSKQVWKPEPDYNYHSHWWLPRQLYDYLIWLDKWVMKWMTGKITEKDYKERLKSLVIIGETRTGKTELAFQFGQYTYMANLWILDQWENKSAYTIFDDIDPNTAGGENKGLNFGWFKGFFACQKGIGGTDKFRKKILLKNGKPLIWLSNYTLEETFKNQKDINYIKKNCIVVELTKPLYEPPNPSEWIEGHSDYVEYDTKETCYYKNIYLPNLLKKEEEYKKKKEQKENEEEDDATENLEESAAEEEEEEEEDENEDKEEEEPLSERKRRLSSSKVQLEELEKANNKFEKEQGRLSKKIKGKTSAT